MSYGKGVRPQLVESDCFNNCINVYAYQCRVRPSDIQNIEQGMLPGGHHWGCTTGTRTYPSGHHNSSKDWLSLLKSKGTQSPEKREDPTQRQVTRRTVTKTTTSGTSIDLKKYLLCLLSKVSQTGNLTDAHVFVFNHYLGFDNPSVCDLTSPLRLPGLVR